MCNSWLVKIHDTLRAINYIIEDTKDMDFEDFLKNRILRQATERNIELIGEALNSIPKDIQIKYQNVDWRNIIGMRDYLIHQYFDVMPDIIWEVASLHIYELQQQLIKILQTEQV
ncbi:MAG: DUF86 domain-containing protein [Candidatus Cloacimonetes bacterium]|nr:DUF86 domain-containing protein [Candidatus Cloacimonadota bacterium]